MTRSGTDPVQEADILVIGAGLAGALAALLLARQGLRVAVIDRHAVFPPEFRCEKLSRPQLALLRELDLLDCFAGLTRRFERVFVAREGRALGTLRVAEQALDYAEMVNAVRRAWPAHVNFLEAQVADIATTDTWQRVCCTDGRALQARLIVLATGPRDGLHLQIGISRHVRRRAHSLCAGFNLVRVGGEAFAHEAITYFSERSGDKVGYATLFPMRDTMRVNVFTYHAPASDFVRDMRRDPVGMLRHILPGLQPLLGEIRLAGRVEIRASDLYEAENYVRPGVVLIGDAFRSSCPATGTGVTRILSDVRQLA